jgi:GTP-binding protein
MKIIELIIDEQMELSGIDAISIVENPAIEEDFIALKTEQKEYHFAEVSKEKRRDFEKMIFDYLLHRENLTCLFVLIDIRIKPQIVDIEFMNRMVIEQVPFHIVFTKADKLSQKQVGESVELYKNYLLESWETLPTIFITSAEKHVGREDIMKNIEQLIQTSPYKIGK